MRRTIQILLLAGALWAQNSANTPVKLAYTCSENDLAAAGMTCSDESPCPVYVELSSVSALGRKVLVAGNLHGPSATIGSVLLVSDDDGATWKEPSPRIAGSALDQSQWLDAQHAWAAGEVQVPLSRDPFLLITSDGGATWRQKDVAEDSIPGEIMRFWFDTPEHGELIVDGGRSAEGGRYQLYESRTGGDTWSILSKTSDPPKLRRTPGLIDPNYRIGTDNRTKTYVVEKRNGADWSTVASFAIQVASCGSPAPPPEPAADAK
jgi:photosystem II stability/assembly factor-like uncharacterized protein